MHVGNALRDALSAGGQDNITKDTCQGEYMEFIYRITVLIWF